MADKHVIYAQGASTHRLGLIDHGIRGADIPSSGDAGPPPLYDDVTLPADADVRFRMVLSALPSSGTLRMENDSSFLWPDDGESVADGSYTATGQRYRNGTADGAPETITLTMGLAPAVVAGSAALAAQSAQLAGAGVRSANASAALAASPGAVSGVGIRTVQGTAALSAGDSALAGTGTSGDFAIGAGAFACGPSTLAGVGVRSVAGAGALASAASALAGASGRTSIGVGVLVCGAAALVGTDGQFVPIALTAARRRTTNLSTRRRINVN